MAAKKSLLFKILSKLVIFLVSAVVMVIGGELLARVAEPGPFALFDSNPYLVNQGGFSKIHKPDFEGRWDGTWYSTNSKGLRGPEVPEEKAPGEVRVVCVGDSCTFGKGVAEEDCYPRQLEQILSEELGSGRTATVVNCGVNGYSGPDYATMLAKIGLPLKPDVVVVGYNLNDFPNVLKKIDEVTTKQAPVRTAVKKVVGGQRNLDRLNESALFRFTRALYYDWKRAKAWEDAERFASESAEQLQSLKRASDKANDEEHMQKLEEQIAGIKQLVEGGGAKLALFLFPYESQVYLEEYDRTPIERLRQICAGLDVPFVDLAEEFRRVAYESDPPREMFVFGDRYHPRPVGYRIVAENVVRVLRESGWLKQS